MIVVHPTRRSLQSLRHGAHAADRAGFGIGALLLIGGLVHLAMNDDSEHANVSKAQGRGGGWSLPPPKQVSALLVNGGAHLLLDLWCHLGDVVRGPRVFGRLSHDLVFVLAADDFLAS
jgi:hypothetical protein